MAQRSSLNLVLFPFCCSCSFYILLLNQETLNNNYEKQLLKHSFECLWEKWVAISFSRGSSRPRDWTWVSHIVDRCFTIWATREVREKRNQIRKIALKHLISILDINQYKYMTFKIHFIALKKFFLNFLLKYSWFTVLS